MAEISKEAELVRSALIKAGLETPLIPVAMDSAEKKEQIAAHFRSVMQILGLDLTDDSLEKSPERIARMYVDEIFSGLDYANFPKITVIENKMHVDEIVKARDITMTSTC